MPKFLFQFGFSQKFFWAERRLIYIETKREDDSVAHSIEYAAIPELEALIGCEFKSFEWNSDIRYIFSRSPDGRYCLTSKDSNVSRSVAEISFTSLDEWQGCQRRLNLENLGVAYEPEKLVGKYFLATQWPNREITFVFKESQKPGENYVLYHHGLNQNERREIDVSHQSQWERLVKELGLEETNENKGALSQAKLAKTQEQNLFNEKIEKICRSEKSIILEHRNDIFDLELNDADQVVRIVLAPQMSQKRSHVTWDDFQWVKGLKHLEGFGEGRELKITQEILEEIFGESPVFYLYEFSESVWRKVERQDGKLLVDYDGRAWDFGVYQTGKIIPERRKADQFVTPERRKISQKSFLPALQDKFQLKLREISLWDNRLPETESNLALTETTVTENTSSLFDSIDEIRTSLENVFAQIQIVETGEMDAHLLGNLKSEFEAIKIRSEQSLNLADEINLARLDLDPNLEQETELIVIRNQLAHIANVLAGFEQNRQDIVSKINFAIAQVEQTWYEINQALADEKVKQSKIKAALKKLEAEPDTEKRIKLHSGEMMTVAEWKVYYQNLLTQVVSKIEVILADREDFKIKAGALKQKLTQYLTPLEIENKKIVWGWIIKKRRGLKEFIIGIVEWYDSKFPEKDEDDV